MTVIKRWDRLTRSSRSRHTAAAASRLPPSGTGDPPGLQQPVCLYSRSKKTGQSTVHRLLSCWHVVFVKANTSITGNLHMLLYQSSKVITFYGRGINVVKCILCRTSESHVLLEVPTLTQSKWNDWFGDIQEAELQTGAAHCNLTHQMVCSTEPSGKRSGAFKTNWQVIGWTICPSLSVTATKVSQEKNKNFHREKPSMLLCLYSLKECSVI